MNGKHTIALIKDTVGHTMKRVVRELGTPALPQQLLSPEQSTFLRNQIPGLPKDHAEINRMVVTNLMSGKVAQVGNTAEGSSLFTVHVPLDKDTCVLTLEYYRDEWQLHRIESVRTRRKQINQTLVGGVVGAAIAAAVALLIWGVGGKHDAIAEAKAQGYVVLTQAQYQEQVPLTAGQPAKKTAGKTGTATDASKTGTTTGSADAGQSITFTMAEGMNTGDLTSWLKDNGLITDQASFNQKLTQQGIDTKLRPKDYVFKKGMSEADILGVLQQ
ncbi:MAG: hypothetical protein ACXVDJ_07385 [Tumebacillaceae bacterium]